jgi:putative ABC transport system permease protein
VEIGNRFEVAIPLCSDPLFWERAKARPEVPTAWWLSLMGRLKPGWTIARANAQIQAISPAIMRETLPPSYRPDRCAKKYLANKLTVTSGATGVSQLRRQYEDPLWILLATTGLVLLIACANLANLLLARASVREREIAVRQAIGASRGRLVAQLLSESMLLACSARRWARCWRRCSAAGWSAFLTTEGNKMFVGLGIDWRILGFTAGVAMLTCVLFGLVPALRATRVAPAAVMRASGRGLTGGREKFSMRRILVVAQVAMSLVLLAGALLFVRSLQKLLAVDPGFRPEGIVAVGVDYRAAHFPKERITRSAAADAGEAAAKRRGDRCRRGGYDAGQRLGLGSEYLGRWRVRAAHRCQFQSLRPGYFRTMGTSFRGRPRLQRARRSQTRPRSRLSTRSSRARSFRARIPVGLSFRREESADKPDSVFQVVGWCATPSITNCAKISGRSRSCRRIRTTTRGRRNFVLRTNAPLGEFYHNAEQAVAESIRDWRDFTVLTTQIKESLMRDRLMAALAGAFGCWRARWRCWDCTA